MFNRPPKIEHPKLNELIDDALTQTNASDDDFTDRVDAIEKLMKLKKINSRERVSPDTIALVLGNLAGVAMIVGHERMNVISSKALGFIKMAR